MRTNEELVDAVAEAYLDWQGFLERGCCDDFDAVAEGKQQEYGRVRAELLARLSGGTQ